MSETYDTYYPSQFDSSGGMQGMDDMPDIPSLSTDDYADAVNLGQQRRGGGLFSLKSFRFLLPFLPYIIAGLIIVVLLIIFWKNIKTILNPLNWFKAIWNFIKGIFT